MRNDDDVDEDFVQRKRRGSSKTAQILGIMGTIYGVLLFVAIYFTIELNKDRPVPQGFVQEPSLFPPAQNMGEVYARLAFFCGVGLVALSALGYVIYQGVMTQQRRRTQRRRR